ncbi:MAG: adenine phosphoribosyltransferase [Kiritimatiellia bacterium]|nr:adenine phosphoribosyltransferase [Kiritimatiellia bacterium]
MDMNIKKIKSAIRDIPDFPQKGVIFKDITPVLADPKLLKAAVNILGERHAKGTIAKVAAVDARGFIFGAAVALKLGAGFIPVRKKGKLPFTTIEQSYDLEYGSATLSMHTDAIKPGETILIVDDLLATGGTAAATAAMIEKLDGKIVEIAFLIELAFLKGRTKLTNYPVFSAIVF